MSSIEKYGRFDEKEKCFRLVNEPPRKWVNLHFNTIGEREIYAETTNIGDGLVWTRDNEGVTMTIVGYDAKYLYIRDEENGVVFSPWGAPAPQEVKDKECRYYAAKTEVSSTCNGLRVTFRQFCPKDYVIQAWTVTIRNLTARPRALSVFAYAMFQLGGCDKEGRYVGKDNYAVVMRDINGVFIRNRNTQAPTDRFNGYIVTLQKMFAGTGYRDHFMRSEFASGTPKILWGWDCDNKPGFGPDCAGAVQVHVSIAAKATGRVDFLIGQATGPDEVKTIRKAITPRKLDAMCDEQAAVEEKRAGRFLVDVGNRNINGLMNIFVKKQLYSYLINKSGFRDNLQLDCALALCDYPAAEANILRALGSQYADGKVPHGFRPLNRLQYSDKPAWILMAVPWLMKESGNLELLDAKVPYFESREKGTVWDHMLRAMRFLAGDTGRHGFCRQHHADWNDGLEATKESGDRESIMVTQQLCFGLLEVEEIAGMIGDTAVQKEARALYDQFKKRLNEGAWDGKWYIRTYCEDGYRIGSHRNEEGKMFVNTQSWAILSKTAPEDRAALCMRMVDKLLTVDVGYRICAPGFSKYDPRVGHMSNSMPGNAENGGCYNHAAGFKGVADCMLGRAEQAWDTFIKVAPDSPLNPVSRSQIEPFSFTNSYSMCEYAYGRSGYPWRTGTAAWFTMLLIEWILGARRGYKGLLIDPCMTKRLKTASVVRTFRGARYEISLDNSAGRCTGARSITLDGKKIDGNVLPDLGKGTHKVRVVI